MGQLFILATLIGFALAGYQDEPFLPDGVTTIGQPPGGSGGGPPTTPSTNPLLAAGSEGAPLASAPRSSSGIAAAIDARDGAGFARPGNPAHETCLLSNPAQFCDQILWWDEKSRDQPAVLLSPPGFAASSPFAGSLQAADITTVPTDRNQCLDIQCICQFSRGTFSNNRCTLPNGQVYGKAVRKELRLMTDTERARFQRAMWGIRQGAYRDLGVIHSSYSTSPGAHSGPAFLPWHREFIKRMEFALRQYDPTVALPYWDSTLDAALDDPFSSIMWGEELMGSTGTSSRTGNLNTGLFAGWVGFLNRVTIREFGVSRNSRPTAQASLNAINTEITNIVQALAFSAATPQCPRNNIPPRSAIEFVHGANHIWIGGDMYVTTRATNDPIFFLHHANIDFIWEQWRLSRQSRSQRETAYPTDDIRCSSQSHFARSIMVPFAPIVNIDGCSNSYTDNLYQYDPRPTCSSARRDCRSRFLFCDPNTFTCVSRIREGFACSLTRYRGVDPCYGACVNGRCQAPPRASGAPPQGAAGGAGGAGGAFGGEEIPTQGAPPLSGPEVPVLADETCYNQNPCCATWASQGGCQRDAARMRLVCPASCEVCRPTTYTIQDNCADRHPLCATFRSAGQCTSNPNFMAENCRQTCSLCAQPRSAGCSA